MDLFIYQRLIPFLRRTVVRFVNQFVPKRKNLWVFHSKPVAYRDNSRAFYEYVVEHAPHIEAVWLVDAPGELAELRERGVPGFHWRSRRGLVRLLRAGAIFTTHFGFNDVKVRGQLCINLWHGMPLKSLGFTQQTDVVKRIANHYEVMSKRADLHIATSPLTQLTIAGSFGARPEKVAVTGQPRTDRLFQPAPEAVSALQRRFQIAEMDRMVLWAPTYRKPRTGLRDDGMDLSELLAQDDSAALEELLASHKAHLFIKTHQFEDWEPARLERFQHIHLLTDRLLGEMRLELYDFLSEVDVLITDYSSIYIDFLLLDRPILFFVPDLETYQSRRGFVLEPYDFWTPGPKARSLKEAAERLNRLLSGDEPPHERDRRRQIRDVFHTYVDDQACDRLLSRLAGGRAGRG